MASHTQDDGFHEIQLNGKQLVFLFMAATVASVVIFLCGVLVGRDVGAKRSTATESAALNDGPAADPVRESSSRPVSASSQDPTAAPVPPLPTPDDLSYPDRLNRSATAEEGFKAASPKPDAPSPVAKQAAAAPAKAAAPAASTMAVPGPGFAVQVAALNVRSEADAIARRLSAKGYAAYVQPPASGKPNVFRVRVGTFKTKREADTVAARLKKEEKFTPWVTR